MPENYGSELDPEPDRSAWITRGAGIAVALVLIGGGLAYCKDSGDAQPVTPPSVSETENPVSSEGDYGEDDQAPSRMLTPATVKPEPVPVKPEPAPADTSTPARPRVSGGGPAAKPKPDVLIEKWQHQAAKALDCPGLAEQYVGTLFDKTLTDPAWKTALRNMAVPEQAAVIDSYTRSTYNNKVWKLGRAGNPRINLADNAPAPQCTVTVYLDRVDGAPGAKSYDVGVARGDENVWTIMQTLESR